MNHSKTFVSIGAGNVATHIVKSLCDAGFTLVQVYSRTLESAEILAKYGNSEYVNSVGKVNKNADFYIVSLPDNVVKSILEQLPISNKLIVHTAGSHGLEIFESKFSKFGVLYPLQSIRKNAILSLSETPFLIEGCNPEVLKEIEIIAGSISKNIYFTDSETRRWIHLAAIFANNFTNHMLSLSSQILKQKNIDTEILKPIIQETFRKALEMNAEDAQTGPAVRNDTSIIDAHIKMLEDQALLQKIYTFTSQSIQKTQSEKQTKPINE